MIFSLYLVLDKKFYVRKILETHWELRDKIAQMCASSLHNITDFLEREVYLQKVSRGKFRKMSKISYSQNIIFY